MSRQRDFFLLAAAAGLALGLMGFAQDTPPTKKPGTEAKQAEPPAKKNVKKRATPFEEVLRIADGLTAKDLKDRILTSSYHKAYPVKMSPGRTYVIRLYGQGGNIDPYLRLEDSTGRSFMEDDDGEGSLNSRIEHNPAREDTYRVIATNLRSNAEGKFLLTVEACPPGRVPPRQGSPGALAHLIQATPVQTPVPIKTGDLEITATTFGESWSSGEEIDTHGYVEYRFTIENRSPTQPHRVTLSLPARQSASMGHYLHALRTTVTVEPQSSARATLYHPDLPVYYASNQARVEIDGSEARELVNFQLASQRGQRTSRGMHFFGSRPPGGVAPTVGVLAAAQLSDKLGFQVQQIQNGVPFRVVMHPAANDLRRWSTHWLGYSSFDSVLASGPELKAAPREVLAALWQYVECGGTLIIVGDARVPPSWDRPAVKAGVFVEYYPGFGQCLVTATPLEKWSPREWTTVCQMWSTAQSPWLQIMSPTDANRELPVVSDLTIPVRGLFVVMILFVLVIGPVNVYWLSRAKRRIWLLWTVPVFAAFTCLLLVGYMVATEGWHGHVHAKGITLLDETAQRGTTLAWQGYYCPTSPRGGLRFSLDTELTPHLNLRHTPYSFRARQPCSIDWTDEQHLTDSWVTPKVPIHFLVRRGEQRLERLTVRADPDGAGSVVNGLGADIKSLWLARTDGAILTAKDIGAGATATLVPTDARAQADLGILSEVFGGNWLQEFDRMTTGPAEYLRPGCYIAIIDDSPFLEPGLRQTQSRRLRSVVYGIMKEPLP